MKDIKFSLYGSPWTIKFNDNVFTEVEGKEMWAFGLAVPTERKIFISTKTEDGKKIPVSELKLTVLHEVVHAIFVTGQYLGENQDEPLVEWVARCLYNFMSNNTFNNINNIHE